MPLGINFNFFIFCLELFLKGWFIFQSNLLIGFIEKDHKILSLNVVKAILNYNYLFLSSLN